MTRHAHPDPAADTAAAPTPEPVLIASAVQTVLGAVAVGGWTYLTDARIAAFTTAVAAVLAAVTAVIARGRVHAIRTTSTPPPPPALPAGPLDAQLLEQLREVVRAELADTRPTV